MNAKIILVDGVYHFDASDGSPLVPLKVWLEKSKASEAHPDGKPWILLPKGNVTNRQYYSEDLFINTNVDGVVEVEVKTTAPRVLGATGVKQDVLKYLSDEEAAEYTKLVENAVALYKSQKTSGSMKLEDMTEGQLVAYLDALRNGEKFTPAAGPKSFLDVFTTEQYDRYNELLAIAQETKANTPKAPRAKLTDEQKAARAEKAIAKKISLGEALLAKLRAEKTQSSADAPVEE